MCIRSNVSSKGKEKKQILQIKTTIFRHRLPESGRFMSMSEDISYLLL